MMLHYQAVPDRRYQCSVLACFDLSEGSVRVRGDDELSGHLFSYLSPEQRVPADHPLRAIRTMTDEALRRLSPRFGRMTDAIAMGGDDVAPVLQALRERDARLFKRRGELASATRLAGVGLPAGQELDRLVQGRVAELRDLLRGHVTTARKVLRELIIGRITIAPLTEARRYRLSLTGSLSRFFSGIVDTRGVASPPRLAHIGGRLRRVA